MKTICTFFFLLMVTVNGNAQAGYDFFDVNNYKALISPSGNHFWDFNDSRMYIPYDSANSPTALFTSNVWVGGIAPSGQLHFAGERFNQSGRDFHPGPHSDVTDTSATAQWDRVWKVNRAEVMQWLAAGATAGTLPTPPQAVQEWPAHGNSAAPFNESFVLAPFVDINGDGQYNPAEGDHPKIMGDQSVFFMYNDHESIHTESGGQILGIEVLGMAYGFDCPEDEALQNTLFFHYEIRNRSSIQYDNAYIGLWNDVDLGNPQDDYMGCDPLRNLFFAYNGDNDDQNASGKTGYGVSPPAIGLRILNGIPMTKDQTDNLPSLDSLGNYNGFGMNDGIVDNERLGLSNFIVHNNGSGPLGDPNLATDSYALMSGRWKDGTQLTYGSTGYDPTNPNAITARFMFPDSSDGVNYGTFGVPTNEAWHEVSAGNFPGDRRGLGSMGPFAIGANATMSFDIAYIFSRSENGHIESVKKLKEQSDHIQELFNSQMTACGPFEISYSVGLKDGVSEVSPLLLFPNPARDMVRISTVPQHKSFKVYNLQGSVVHTDHLLNGQAEMQTHSLPRGVYFVQSGTGDNAQFGKLILN